MENQLVNLKLDSIYLKNLLFFLHMYMFSTKADVNIFFVKLIIVLVHELIFLNPIYSVIFDWQIGFLIIISTYSTVLFFSASAAYKQSFIETEGGLKNVFAQKIFCGWDFSIATNEAANLKSHAIYHELKVRTLNISEYLTHY